MLAVERAYVALATQRMKHPETARLGDAGNRGRALAAIGAVASRYLAVGTPRTFGLVCDPTTIDDAALSLAAHRTWFAPREVRCADTSGDGAGKAARDLTRVTSGTLASLAEVLASDIVCVHATIEIRAVQLRRGTHVNVLGSATLDDELRALATIADEAGLGALAAGLVDGRQLDELTAFIAGDAQVALAALR